MSKPWFGADLATAAGQTPRGAAAVGLVAELPVLEQGAVLLMRHWCAGAEGRSAVQSDFAFALGPERGAVAVEGLAHLLGLITQHSRRPFMQHAPQCNCLGGDESAFALMVAAATAGDTEDAMALALTLMPPAIAFEAVRCAEGLGLYIQAMARHLRRHVMPVLDVTTRRH